MKEVLKWLFVTTIAAAAFMLCILVGMATHHLMLETDGYSKLVPLGLGLVLGLGIITLALLILEGAFNEER